ncbi:YgjP-like metallopeptidase domain-containing protein [Geoglobus acetivorans]|uniref:M48 family metallopeptidase n=1 Tax=Geoglobus acetivorans TaxID=565033 RepID=A0ABZ3H1N2_GEOAI|nr:M48 family metallopeptidase [Geoglobus acetivorans]
MGSSAIRLIFQHQSCFDDKIVISIPDGRNPYVYLRNWIKGELRRKLEEYLSEYSSLMNVRFNRFFIKAHKSKWGSCSARKNLNFNIKLAALPEELVKYVVVHELTHLIERKHNRYFWLKVSRFCPDYNEKEKMLAKYWFVVHSNKLWLKLLEK